ncbi:MAG: pyridoxal-phosphate dependent enzyme [Lachnospiraceae bacterium]|nr:pyridoxal-phosphate dependent enzyme [Lachnospiraceae bacterium]
MNEMTPIQALPDINGCHVFIKREDLLPFSFGGNKVRIAEAFFDDMERKGGSCMVGYGNARSNLSRALSAMARARNVPCRIISPDDEDGSRTETFNSRLVRAAGAGIASCPKTRVKETVEAVLAECRAEGLVPYYIYGDSDGRGNEAVPSEAYVKTAAEIAAQEKGLGLKFDRIYLALGTGMTQAGLMLGAALLERSWEIIGISIARPADRCRTVLRERMEAYLREKGLPVQCLPEPLVRDAYLLGGYGKWNEAVAETIREMYGGFGIPLDPTYSGKAFWGMRQDLEQDAPPGGNILFLHTGGGPLFFDFLQSAL